MALTIPEILELVDKADTKQAKLDLLKKYDNEALKVVLILNFHPTVKMDLPEGEPPFKKDPHIPVGYADTSLLQEVKRFYVWLKSDVNLSRIKKESLFISLLEGLHLTEAEVLCLAKDQKLTKKYKTIKEDLVREAFPGSLPEKKLKQPKTKVPSAIELKTSEPS